MDKLRVAIFIEESCLPTEGGGYSYYQTLVKESDKHLFSEEIEICYLLPARANSTYTFSKAVMVVQQGVVDRILSAALHKLYRFVHWLYPYQSRGLLDAITRVISKITNRNAIKTLNRHKVDLVYYLKPNDHPMDFPMIVTHWDVGHKSMYPFPEVASNGNYRKREFYYTDMLSKALLILCESAAGAEELSHYYPINRDKIKVLPLFGGEVVALRVGTDDQDQILQDYGLKKECFYLYPAQFWAHKNHFNLVMAFKKLLEKNANSGFKLLLCGADQGNMTYIKDVVSSLQLSHAVIFTGFITNEVLYTFYKNAISLVMPTYLGPTNLPLIEAAMLSCAVACSDLKGHREILGEAALYFNPADATAISSRMNEMLDPELRSSLQYKGLKNITASVFHVRKSLEVLEQILVDIKPVRKAWGSMPGVLQLITCANLDVINF